MANSTKDKGSLPGVVTSHRQRGGPYQLKRDGVVVGQVLRLRDKTGFILRLDSFYWRKGVANRNGGISGIRVPTLTQACQLAQEVLSSQGMPLTDRRYPNVPTQHWTSVVPTPKDSVTFTTTITRAQIPPKLIDDLKILQGLPPHHGFNPCRGDGYFSASIITQYGENMVHAAMRLVIEPMQQEYEHATAELVRRFS